MISVLHLGLVDYGTALRLQETLVELRKQQRIPDVLLLLEHPPVITLGRNAKQSNIVTSREFLSSKGVEVFEINRGGDVTFHGPGQLVAYPIFDLRGLEPKLGAVDYVRNLEAVLMRTCAQYGIETQRIKGLTGVWTSTSPPPRELEQGAASGLAASNAALRSAGERKPETPNAPDRRWPERKIAAIGVHIARGVTSHGLALNVTTDLDFFNLIVPCGISGKQVTSIEFETGLRLTMAEILPVLARNFGFVFHSQILWLQSLQELLPDDGVMLQAPAPQDTPAKAPEELRRLREQDTHFA